MLQYLARGLLSLSPAHVLVTVLAGVLVLCLIIQFVLTLILQGRENRFSRFFSNITGPILDPLDRIIPSITIGGLSFRISWLFGWWAINIVAALLIQSLPSGW